MSLTQDLFEAESYESSLFQVPTPGLRTRRQKFERSALGVEAAELEELVCIEDEVADVLAGADDTSPSVEENWEAVDDASKLDEGVDDVELTLAVGVGSKELSDELAAKDEELASVDEGMNDEVELLDDKPSTLKDDPTPDELATVEDGTNDALSTLDDATLEELASVEAIDDSVALVVVVAAGSVMVYSKPKRGYPAVPQNVAHFSTVMSSALVDKLAKARPFWGST
nr:uncharacterized protein CTRU02_13694 [Colletotrichum truncatum]KAF6783042.1 hypothetical protein CTRU02_13694 [Colletotrichum truncatum]